MDHPSADPLRCFRLKPLRAARVSEISESTAASGVAPDERVNFHIGNPLQDRSLASAYLRIALGLDVRAGSLADDAPESLMQRLGWEAQDRPKIDLLSRLVRRSAPYMPRGGYARDNPGPVVLAFHAWLEKQHESLSYDLGQTSGRREIVLASGGIQESLRVLMHALAEYLVVLPARILLHRVDFDPLLRSFDGLEFHELPDNERAAREEVAAAVEADHPAFLVLGDRIAEETRRALRAFSLSHPLFFVEANDAPNHLSLAREAKLVDRVLRLLTPAVLSPRLGGLSTVFAAGNADLLAVFESVHFRLKGTPSASEIELLAFLLEQGPPGPEPSRAPADFVLEPAFEGFGLGAVARHSISGIAATAERRLEAVVAAGSRRVGRLAGKLEGRAAHFARHLDETLATAPFDQTGPLTTREFVDELIARAGDGDWGRALLRSYLGVFVRHHPEYKPATCTVVSGSSRTALGLLGLHCGIEEIVVPDLSWSYEHCFPSIRAVPLTPGLELDGPAILAEVDARIAGDIGWIRRGAVVLNNPHNATGRVFDSASVRDLVAGLLVRGVRIIDDLSYQNVIPDDRLPHIETVREHADRLARSGLVTGEQSKRVITVHSISKTDCLAGARLAVVEIREPELLERFRRVNAAIRPNLAAVGLSYLLYRADFESVRSYWRLRNRLFRDRTDALLDAAADLPDDRNPFGIAITPPAGSMYPLLTVSALPSGLSLDWLASGLARQGIGILPLTTFARTESGFETGRTTFRLTLGGTDGAESLRNKTRRLLIDLNRIVAEEAANYNRRAPSFRSARLADERRRVLAGRWEKFEADVIARCGRRPEAAVGPGRHFNGAPVDWPHFVREYVPERLGRCRDRLFDRALIASGLVRAAVGDDARRLSETLDREFYKDALARRGEQFRLRLYDRTVHPTQMYSLAVEREFERVVAAWIRDSEAPAGAAGTTAAELVREYLGLSVPITSSDEGSEIILDLDTLVAAEQYSELFTDDPQQAFLSFWGDWDGSNRPSGQGHRLAAAVVTENVNRQARIMRLLAQARGAGDADPGLLQELERLPARNARFARLLNEITQLTHQLERRYRGVLPFSVRRGAASRLGRVLHLRRDPFRALWQHNDRLERRMLDLRTRRSEMLEYYFALNRKLRKQLRELIPAICERRGHIPLLLETCLYRDLLKRVVITPRIQEKQIEAKDQFAIDTTVHNLFEINAVSGRHGNPGLVLALQVSLSSKPEMLIALDRKMTARRDQTLRGAPTLELPPIWLIPLFEELEPIRGITSYLGKIWDHAFQSRRAGQEVRDRFAEIVPEVFIAGSDLSQQVSQASGAALYRQAKRDVMSWLAERGLADRVRMKLGSGEPMQRQGGYYSPLSGQPAFSGSPDARRRFETALPAAARGAVAHAVTPLMGVFSGADLRTFQSNLSEQVRLLPARDLVELLHHVRTSQARHRADLLRAVEALAESRLQLKARGTQELDRLTLGAREELYGEFLAELTDCYRQILYGREEDVVGIHAVSYFIARSMPQLRDRPTNRRVPGAGAERGREILAGIAETIPFARHGSLLRAIAHNQAQTCVLGVNQLTTGLFRALERYGHRKFAEAERLRMIGERLLPHLNVYEILQSLRLFHDPSGSHVSRVELAFPPGNSAFVALREDSDAMRKLLPLVQRELLRRHGLDVRDFFAGDRFVPDLLPTLRPDLAVLLQPDVFNTSPDTLLETVAGRIGDRWKSETARLLRLPESIREWRLRVWEILEESVLQRVRSFTELATALNTLSSVRTFSPAPVPRAPRIPPALAGFFRSARSDDEMRNFLVGAIEYLSSLSESDVEIPVSVVRAMSDAERIAQIEELVLPAAKQDMLRFYALRMARVAGENG